LNTWYSLALGGIILIFHDFFIALSSMFLVKRVVFVSQHIIITNLLWNLDKSSNLIFFSDIIIDIIQYLSIQLLNNPAKLFVTFSTFTPMLYKYQDLNAF